MRHCAGRRPCRGRQNRYRGAGGATIDGVDTFDPREVQADWWAEAHDLVDALGHTLVLAQAHNDALLSAAHIDAMFRDAHTLKGLLRTLECAPLADVASSVEDALDHLRMGRMPNGRLAAGVLLRGVETLAAGCARAAAGVALEEQVLADVQRQLSQQAALSGSVVHASASTTPTLAPAGELDDLEQHRVASAQAAGRRIVRVSTRLPIEQMERGFADTEATLRQYGEVLARVPSHVPNDESLLAFDFLLAANDPQLDVAAVATALHGTACVSAVIASDVAREVGQAPALMLPVRDAPPQSLPHAARPPAPIISAPAAGRAAPAGDAVTAQTVRVDIRRLDRLLHWVSELMLSKQSLQKIGGQLREQPGGAAVAIELLREGELLERRAAALQAGLMQMRMVPIGQLFDRLLRAGQQAAHELGKEVRFVVHGEATELDKHIAEKLVDPMMHLVRNAVDHGIERPEVRRSRGKVPFGTVRLTAKTRGSQVVVQVSDDGSGIDVEAARQTAVARQVITAQAAPLLDAAQIYALLSHPGFSTRREVSAYSGRGVGLDVAKTELERLGGALEVAANEPCGAVFSLVTPVTLAIVSAMVVKSAGQQYALPLGHVVETLAYSEVDTFEASAAQRMLRVRGHVMPLLDLAHTFGLTESASNDAALQYVVVVGIAQKRLALLVNDLVTQQDIVIKSLGNRLAGATLFAGAAEIGGRQLVLVLNTLALLQHAEDGRDGHA